MSLPHALSGQHVYKVRIEAIDGVPVAHDLWYEVPAGRHLIDLSLMLDVEWSPDLRPDASRPYSARLELPVNAGWTYQIAARVDTEAPLGSQLDGSFWQPFVFRKFRHGTAEP